MEGEWISSSFDGTTRLGEAVNMVNRWCSADFRLQKRLTMFKTLIKHMDHKQLARLIGEKLFIELKVSVLHHVAFERDSCKVNGCAVEKLCSMFDASEDILCMCHTLCHVGEHIELPTLEKFIHHWIGLVYSHAGAKAAWKELIGSVTGYSTVRWYATAEIEMEIAINFGLLEKAIATFEERDYGDAHTKAMRKIYNENTMRLELEFAAMLDSRRIVSTCYELEGDRLEILIAYDRIEVLRAHGRALGDDGTIPNVDAVIRKYMKIKKNTLIVKEWQGRGFLTAKVLKKVLLQSELSPGQNVDGWKVKYDIDGGEEDYEEPEIRRCLVVKNDSIRKEIVAGLKKGYEYLEDRLHGPPRCDKRYDCSTMYEMLRLVRAVDPSFAANEPIDTAWVKDMAKIKPLAGNGLIDMMVKELPDYLAAAKGVAFDHKDIDKFTENVLTWWRNHGTKFPSWALAARIIFAFSPNSAACERVFSLLEAMFTKEQHSSLADQIQAALMLKYNKRVLG